MIFMMYSHGIDFFTVYSTGYQLNECVRESHLSASSKTKIIWGGVTNSPSGPLRISVSCIPTALLVFVAIRTKRMKRYLILPLFHVEITDITHTAIIPIHPRKRILDIMVIHLQTDPDSFQTNSFADVFHLGLQLHPAPIEGHYAGYTDLKRGAVWFVWFARICNRWTDCFAGRFLECRGLRNRLDGLRRFILLKQATAIRRSHLHSRR